MIECEPRWQGYVDYIDDYIAVGWAYDTHYPNVPMLVEISDGAGRSQLIKADSFRQDLEEHNIGDGRHGFYADLSSMSSSNTPIGISIYGTEKTLAEFVEPATLDLSKSLPGLPGAFVRFFSLIAAETSADIREGHD